jgi:hypothetical protein
MEKNQYLVKKITKTYKYQYFYIKWVKKPIFLHKMGENIRKNEEKTKKKRRKPKNGKKWQKMAKNDQI